tara:strand:+ start:449 stop:1141 length:693 start_codon:yes stop_codon:yes gene_type:complete
MIKTTNIKYQYQEWPFEKPDYHFLVLDIFVWLIGLPIIGLVLIMPVQLLIRLLVVDNSIYIIRVLGLITIIVSMIFGFKKILKHRRDQYESWLEEKEMHEKEVAGAYAEKFTITNIIQYWPIEEEGEPVKGYLIRTQENEWFYIISDQLYDFDEDYFPKSQVTIIRAPLSHHLLEILTQGREVEYMDTVKLYQFIDDYSYMELGFDILDLGLCQTLQASLLEDQDEWKSP